MALDFQAVLHNLLNRWTGLRLAVEHSSGGSSSRQKALYLVEYLDQALKQNTTVESEDLEDLIADFMDEQLATVLEDGSVVDITRTILRLWTCFQTGDMESVTGFLGSLPPCPDWLNAPAAPRPKTTPLDAASDSDSSEADESEPQLEPMDCEWTEISYRKKR